MDENYVSRTNNADYIIEKHFRKPVIVTLLTIPVRFFDIKIHTKR